MKRVGGKTTWPPDRSQMALRPWGRLADRLCIDLPFESSFVQAAPNPVYRHRVLKRWGRTLYLALLRPFVPRPGPPTLVTHLEWDHLLLFDACRWDALCAVLDAEVPAIVSPASATLAWVRASIVAVPEARNTLRDVWLVTANPWHSEEWFRQSDWPFPYGGTDSLWKTRWNDEYGTVLPADVAETAATRAREGWRVFAHFAQPHFPPATVPLRSGDLLGPRADVDGEPMQTATSFIWGRISGAEISLSRAVELYEDNLRAVLAEARAVRSDFPGRVLVTSDHGNLFGEYGLYGHPGDFCVPELVIVPWMEL